VTFWIVIKNPGENGLTPQGKRGDISSKEESIEMNP